MGNFPAVAQLLPLCLPLDEIAPAPAGGADDSLNSFRAPVRQSMEERVLFEL